MPANKSRTNTVNTTAAGGARKKTAAKGTKRPANQEALTSMIFPSLRSTQILTQDDIEQPLPMHVSTGPLHSTTIDNRLSEANLVNLGKRWIST